ncbi:transport and Golgi organization protein 11 [Hyalella azteca]|uniref:Mitochondrial fission factor n=1 Tax=Hyalella azteca TaxID=294128 RepID=A0A8B7NM39_HYAAZ|nr:transport and Golgi organization protein 11 [Hyalella azteca]
MTDTKMSSSTNSPLHRFSGSYDSFYTDAATAAAAINQDDINGRMKVPKRIRLTGEHDDSPSVNWENYNKAIPEKLAMSVPERIMVAGGENHIGSRGVPREFEIEDSILPRPPDPTLYRVNTPPRTITLNNYTPDQEEETTSSPQSGSGRHYAHTYPSLVPGPSSQPNHHFTSPRYQQTRGLQEDSPIKNSGAAGIGPLSSSSASPVSGVHEELSPAEELQLLRRQVGRLNRRLMAVELDAQQRSQREVILYTLGLCYCLVRSVLWLNSK